MPSYLRQFGMMKDINLPDAVDKQGLGQDHAAASSQKPRIRITYAQMNEALEGYYLPTTYLSKTNFYICHQVPQG